MSFLLPIAVSNLAASMSEEIFATDASLAKGAIVSTVVTKTLATALWRSADQRVRGVPMMRASEAVAAWADPMFEPCPRGFADDPLSHEVGGSRGEGSGEEKEVPRPLGLWFQFLEICGGAGVVTREILKLGVVAGPVFDLSFSSQYDMVNHNVVMWFIHMMEEGRLLSWLCSPPCTSFSPAAYPAVRSYACPEGFDQTNPKVKIGNKLSYGMLDLMMVARRTKVCGMGETPRRSKMRWLRVWRRLQRMGAKEVFLDSCCAYGSIHQKGFCFLTMNMSAEALSKKCSRDHTHVRIEGKFTKGSAVYCDGLAEALAKCFYDHIMRRLYHEEAVSISTDGLEDVVTNDLCVTRPWTTKKVWSWRGKSHINILESAATLKLASSMARSGGDVRYVDFVDSSVARSVLTRCRSSSDALKALLHQNSAVALAFGLYPAYRFAPTRANPSDHPTRNAEFPPLAARSILDAIDLDGLYGLLSVNGIKRAFANWVRLTLLLSPALILSIADPSSYRRHGIFVSLPPDCSLDFDATLGYPKGLMEFSPLSSSVF